MPILDIEIVGPELSDVSLTQRLADAAGKALDSRPEGAWVKVRAIPAHLYAENEGGGDYQPVFVGLTLARPPEGDALKRQMGELTRAISDVLGRAESLVHITLQPPASGRISFGGVLQE